ncbi:DNA alkylation repair protein [Luteococcus sp. H91]|uniref:DNA alkylation repair protein n=1 Tax=Luteococcus sp. H91 TaxID=3139401 RepID=UPI00313D8247
MGSQPDSTELVTMVLAAGNPDDAPAKAAYLKAIPGGYAEGDVVIGVRVPQLRQIAKAWLRESPRSPSLTVIEALLFHEVHEVRLLAAILLSDLCKAKRTSPAVRQRCVDLVLAHAECLDNWDLVDTVAPYVTGPWLASLSPGQQRAQLLPLIRDPLLWRRRIAMVSMLAVIRAGDVDLPLWVAEQLLDDEHDLIHKAVGWMLREVGAVDRAALDVFLNRHAATMPRTALRYALEKHDPADRARFMRGGPSASR